MAICPAVSTAWPARIEDRSPATTTIARPGGFVPALAVADRCDVEHEPGRHLLLVAATEAETLALMAQPASLAHDAPDPCRPWRFGDGPRQVVGAMSDQR